MNKKALLLGMVLASSQVNAAGLDASQIYFGGGLGYNDIGDDEAVGFQLFAGLPLPVKLGKATLAAEVGYMDSGSFDVGGGTRTVSLPGFPPVTTTVPSTSVKVKGFWGTAVVDFPIQNNISVIGRLGLDIGDDDGLMIGAGLGFDISSKMEIRAEYVIRDNVDSLQANLMFRL